MVAKQNLYDILNDTNRTCKALALDEAQAART